MAVSKSPAVALAATATACFALLPVAALLWVAAAPASGVWPHLLAYVLPRSAWDTAALLIGSGIVTGVVGAGTAWLVAMCRFPGRTVLAWALVLPLAVPAYIAAYAWVEVLDFSGPLQKALRALTGFTSAREYWFPDIRSTGGAVLILSMVLYPYVYLACRVIFALQGARVLDVARSLGAGPWRLFREVGLPIARPALAVGIALVLMECLNDIGAVEILGVRTLTYAVYETWLNRGSLSGAVQLALVVLAIVMLLVWLERHFRRDRSFSTGARDHPPAGTELLGGKAALAFAACFTPVALGFLIPMGMMAAFALRRLEAFASPALLSAAANSLLLAAATAFCACAIAYGLLQLARLRGSRALGAFGRIVTLGYAIPGTVLAIGLLVPLAAFDNALDAFLRATFGISTGLLLSGTIIVLVYACTLRFLAVAYGTVEAGFARVSPSIDMAARALGRTHTSIAWRIHMPILRPALAAAAALVFVDTMKELSATILLRPFGFDTLATLTYERASQAAIEDAAPAAILIVASGLLPILILTRLSLAGATQKKRGVLARPA